MTTEDGPKLIQRKRIKGWRMPEGAVYVGRPSRWGNEWVIGQRCSAQHPFNPHLRHADWTTRSWVVLDRDSSLAHYETDARWLADTNPAWLAPLRGRDLACWCPAGQPCHADVLLELANR